MSTVVLHCWSCGQSVELAAPPARGDECERCGADLRCCKTCRHYEPSAHSQCREPTAEYVADKERQNFCGMYQPLQGMRDQQPEVAGAKAKLEALFKAR